MKFIKLIGCFTFCCASLFFMSHKTSASSPEVNPVNCRLHLHPLVQSRLQAKCVLSISEEDRVAMSNRIKGVKLNFPSELRLLNNDRIDMSDFIREINKTVDSDYDNSGDIFGLDLLFFREYYVALCSKTKNSPQCFFEAVYGKDSLDSVIEEIRKKKSGKILYPLGYTPIGNLGKDDFEKAFQLDTSCLEKCSDRNLVKAVRSSSQTQYKNLFLKIKEQNKECLRDLLKNLGYLLEREIFPEACLKEENKTHIVCEDMTKSLNIIKQRVADLMAMAYEPSQLTEAKAICMDCSEGGEITANLSQLRDTLENLKESESCLELGYGEEKRVKTFQQPMANYILKRDNDGNYHIDFPIEFFAEEDYDGNDPSTVSNIYRKRVQECLKEANTMMLGPNGEKINLSISKIPKCSKTRYSEPVRIGIGSKHHRSNSKKYESDIDCPTITHEILHLAGLCDEYKDRVSYNTEYDCRVVTENSIMSSAWERWDYANENNKSLLTPGHFKSILYGSCLRKNPAYKCSALAYQSSVLDGDSCLQKKAQCEKSNGLGQNKQEVIDFLEEELRRWSDMISVTEEEIKELKEKQNRRDLNTDEKSMLTNRRYRLNYWKSLLQKEEEKLEKVRSWPENP